MTASGIVIASSELSPSGGGGAVEIRWDGGRISNRIPAELAAEKSRKLVMPALANAHDHARGLPLSSYGLAFLPLESWLPASLISAPPDPYLAALVAFGRAAQGGCGVMMAHYTRPSAKMSPLDEAQEVARAARQLGVRLAFAPALRDRNPLVYGDEGDVLRNLPEDAQRLLRENWLKPAIPAREQVMLTEAIADSISGPTIDVQYGPTGVQWCSDELLELVAERSDATGRRVHMHLLETPYQRIWADRAYAGGIVHHLRDIGLLSPRLTLVHCVHARPDEIAMIAESGARIVNNPASNMHLRSGLAPVAQMHACGCGVAIGMDGQSFDEDADMLRELRLANALHGARGYEKTWALEEFLFATILNGRLACGAPDTGGLEVGQDADLLVLDLDNLDRDRLTRVSPIDLLFSRATASCIDRLVVAGRDVVVDGRLAGVALDEVEQELRRQTRQQLAQQPHLLTAVDTLKSSLPPFYRELSGCGM